MEWLENFWSDFANFFTNLWEEIVSFFQNIF